MKLSTVLFALLVVVVAAALSTLCESYAAFYTLASLSGIVGGLRVYYFEPVARPVVVHIAPVVSMGNTSLPVVVKKAA